MIKYKRLIRNIEIYLQENYIPENIIPQIESQAEILIDCCRKIEKPTEEHEIILCCKTPSRETPIEYGFHEMPLRFREKLNVEDVLERTWSSELFYIIDKFGMKDSEVYKRAGVSKQTFSNIRKNLNYIPKRDTAIQLCIGLKLNLDQTVDLLAKAGYTLSPSSKRDLIVKYFINHKTYDMTLLNEVLFEFSLELFQINN